MLSVVFISILLLLPSAHSAEDLVVLPAVIVTGTATDLMLDDGILPQQKLSSQSKNSSGNSVKTFEREISLPVSNYGSSSSLAQFKGFGRSVEDTNVQTLGVPLNLPQGGGFDFSTFPQFFWSAYKFQSGAAPAAHDPRAVSGTLSLTPWTYDALSLGGSGFKSSFFLTTDRLRQYAVSAYAQHRVAALAGYSDGRLQGPAGSLSAIAYRGPQHSLHFHFLGTRMRAESPGAINMPTPGAEQVSARWIPYAQVDSQWSARLQMRSSFFYDGTFYKYDDSKNSVIARNRSEQTGFESALQSEAWRFGLSARRVMFRTLDFKAPKEYISNVSVMNTLPLQWGRVESAVQGAGVSRFGFSPQGSVGLRTASQPVSVFSRVSFARKYPSISDRYYRIPGFFEGNLGLEPESVWTAHAGAESSGDWGSVGLDNMFQTRQQAQVQSLGADGLLRVINTDEAVLNSTTGRASLSVRPWLAWSSSLTWSYSHIKRTGVEFPGFPRLIHTSRLSGHNPGDQRRWEVFGQLRQATSAVADAAGSRTGGYGLVDLGMFWQLEQFRLQAQIDNLADRRQIEIVKNYPLNGRVYSFGLELDL